MSRLGFLWLVLLQCLPFYVSNAGTINDEQRVIIQNALNASRLTGRPILAVAGRNS